MVLTVKLQQKQAQSLVMTPQLAQSIKLLQLSHGELLEFVKEEIEKNPLLELSSDHAEDFRSADLGVGSEQAEGKQAQLTETVMTTTSALDDVVQSQSDSELQNSYDTGTAGAEKQDLNQSQPKLDQLTSSTSNAASIDEFDIFTNLSETPSLVSILERQIALQFKNPQEAKIAYAIAHGLDEDGYFREDLSSFAERNDCSLDIVNWVLERFQRFEPTGVGARSLAECLELQLREKNRFDPAMQILLENIELLAKRDFSSLMSLCGVEKEDFRDMLQEIKALDPRPAREYEPVLAQVVVPDVIITQTHMGGWNIELNPETLPKVLVNREYHVQLSKALGEEEGHKFVAECMENANWLTKSLDQRATTVMKVASEIVKKQDRFFAEGTRYLVPMKLKDVAETIGMHESTVSRVTSNKYLMCERGTFELKFFFSSSVSSSDGEADISAEAVKFEIQQMVNAETEDSILSDQQIVENLQTTGISIARRTVAKYREALQISSSVQRRREKTGKL